MSTTHRLSQRQADTRLSRDGTVTEDASEAYLAEFSFGCETVVYWGHKNERTYGIITGYEDPTSVKQSGRFIIDVVTPGPNADDAEAWRETGEFVKLPRNEFVVFGPANRDPGDREIDPTPEGREVMRGTGSRRQEPWEVAVEVMRSIAGFNSPVPTFVAAVIELLATENRLTGELAYDVRLDVSMDDDKRKRQGAKNNQEYDSRKYRILVKPTEQPMLQSEIEQVIEIATKHDLYVWHSNAGLELHLPGEIPS